MGANCNCLTQLIKNKAEVIGQKEKPRIKEGKTQNKFNFPCCRVLPGKPSF
jgi:hypothetical protein